VATFTLDLNQAVASVTESVGLNAAWGDPNRTAPTSPVSRSFTVLADPNVGPGVGASTLYTGSRFFWTTSATSSTATLTLTATIKDKYPCGATDITKANVSFWISSNGGTSWSQVSNGQNLPVGLVDPADKSTGTASVISQYSIGKLLSAQLWVKVTVGGEYIYSGDEFDVPVTIAVPGQLNTMIAAGGLTNDGVSLASILTSSNNYFASGFFGAGNSTTSGGILAGSVDFGGQVTYTKSLTNPQGQLTLMIHSYNKPDGTQDGAPHTYYVKSNSIADLALVGIAANPKKTASFSSKTNVYELVGGSRNGLDGGGVMQFMFTEPGGTYQVSTGTGNNSVTLTCPSSVVNGVETKPGCASVIAYKSTGGVWFTSAWGPVTVGGLPQTVEKAMKPGSGTYIK
jgi:trimeric autotransporter adhesin